MKSSFNDKRNGSVNYGLYRNNKYIDLRSISFGTIINQNQKSIFPIYEEQKLKDKC